MHSHLKNGWLMRLRVLYKTGAEIWSLKNFSENFEEKFGDLKIMRTFAAPFKKRATTSSLKRLIYCTRSKYRENTIYREALISLRNYKCQWQAKNYIIIIQWRVWSWLRMNASGRLNTCKSRGSMRRRFVEVLMATGARVRNAWATCPFQGDNRWKRRLIPHSIEFRHL